MAAAVNVGHQAYIPRLRAYAASEHVAILAGDLRTHSGHTKILTRRWAQYCDRATFRIVAVPVLTQVGNPEEDC